jgi:NADH-quinone oxidoreductase subunit G
MESATVIAHSAFLTEGVREHAQVVFPLESNAEKDGTIVHPDGRLQRLRQSIARQGMTRPGWQVMQEIGRRLGLELDALTGPMVSKAIFEAIPFYAGLSLDEIGGRGVRWTERGAAAMWPAEEMPEATAPAAVAAANGHLRVGTYRSIWSGAEVQASPALRFLASEARVELSPTDAKRLALGDGQRALVGGIPAKVVLRDAVPAGSAFLQGNEVAEGLLEVRSA